MMDADAESVDGTGNDEPLLERDSAYSYRYCFNPDCNRIYRARVNVPSTYCPACQKVFQKESRDIYSMARHRQSQGALTQNGAWELVSDSLPVSEGGFQPGTRFDFLDMYFSLEASAFQDGVRLRKGNKYYTVINNHLVDDQGKIFKPNSQNLREVPCKSLSTNKSSRTG